MSWSFYKIKRSENVGNIWLEYGTGTYLRFFNVRDLYNSVGETKARGLLFFHAFTGSDTTSALRNKGKKSAWNTWRAFDEITPVFSNLSKQPFKIINSDSQEMAMLQRFVVCLYIESSPLERVNDARKEIFCHKNQNMESLPPTENARFSMSKDAFIRLEFGITPSMLTHYSHTPQLIMGGGRMNLVGPLFGSPSQK